MTITNNIRQVVAARGLTLADCASRLPLISPSQFYRYVNGVTPRLDVALAFADVLETPVGEIWPTKLTTRPVR